MVVGWNTKQATTWQWLPAQATTRVITRMKERGTYSSAGEAESEADKNTNTVEGSDAPGGVGYEFEMNSEGIDKGEGYAEKASDESDELVETMYFEN